MCTVLFTKHIVTRILFKKVFFFFLRLLISFGKNRSKNCKCNIKFYCALLLTVWYGSLHIWYWIDKEMKSFPMTIEWRLEICVSIIRRSWCKEDVHYLINRSKIYTLKNLKNHNCDDINKKDSFSIV